MRILFLLVLMEFFGVVQAEAQVEGCLKKYAEFPALLKSCNKEAFEKHREIGLWLYQFGMIRGSDDLQEWLHDPVKTRIDAYALSRIRWAVIFQRCLERSQPYDPVIMFDCLRIHEEVTKELGKNMMESIDK